MKLDIISHPPQTQVPVVCRLLRTKQTHGTLSNIVTPWQAGTNRTASFWCLATMQSFGPDDDYTHAEKCRDSRSCFRKPLE
jgi:hypothetical protein